jgi:hypothetical protein
MNVANPPIEAGNSLRLGQAVYVAQDFDQRALDTGGDLAGSANVELRGPMLDLRTMMLLYGKRGTLAPAAYAARMSSASCRVRLQVRQHTS